MSIKKEEEIVKYITEYYQRTKFYPSYREISKAVNLQSNSTIYYYMKILEDKGIVIRKVDFSAQYRLNGMVLNMVLNNQSKDNGWIPCSDRMPENEQEVEITYIGKNYLTGEIVYRTARAFYEDGTLTTEKSDYCWNETDDWEYDEKEEACIIPEGWLESVSFTEEFGVVDMPVIAWRPLTEPYRP